MSTRDEASLTDRERAALASLEAVAAAEDPQLARRLRGAKRLRLIAQPPAIPSWLRSRWWAVPLLLFGLALVAIGLSTTVALSIVGSVMTAGGLGILTALVGAVMALAQLHLKRMLAFVTMSHLGIYLIGVGLLTPLGLTGASLLVIGDGVLQHQRASVN